MIPCLKISAFGKSTVLTSAATSVKIISVKFRKQPLQVFVQSPARMGLFGIFSEPGF